MTTPASASLASLAALSPMLSEKCILLSEMHARGLMARVADAARANISPRANEPRGPTANVVTPGQTTATVAVIPVNGVLTKNPTWYDDFCGFCPTGPLMEMLKLAVDDASVSAVVLDIDSPGGFVSGTVEFAEAIAAANRVKPVDAVVRGLCCSGAYWLASQCGTIYARPESETGNIGVYSVLTDVSKWYADIGIQLTLVASGQFKGLGADGKVTGDQVEDTRRIINGLFQQFQAAVIAGRGLDPDEAADLFDGRAWLGPQAKKLGLIDQIASSFDDTIAAIVGANAPARAAMAKTRLNAAVAAAALAAAPKAGESDTGASTNDDVRKSLNDTITSANAHKDQARAALDACNGMSEDPDADTKALAKTAVSSLNAAAEESTRAADAWSGKCDDDADPDGDGQGDDDDDQNQGRGRGRGKQAFGATDYIAAFGDVGARWFFEGKPFAVATKEHIDGLKAAHKVQIDTLTAERDTLKAKLGTIDRGNEAASFTIDPKAAPPGTKGATASGPKKLNNVPAHLEQFASSLTIPKA